MNATNTSGALMEDEDVLRQVMNITLLSIGVPTVLVNIFVITLIVSFKSMRSNANIIIGSMAVTDLMVGTATIIAGIVRWSDWFQVRPLICTMTFILDLWATFASLAHVLAVNLERYLAIVFPLQYKNIMSVKRLQIALFLTWLITLIEAIAYTFAYQFGGNCVIIGTIFPGLAFGILVISNAFPLVAVVGIYIRIVVEVIRKLRFMAKSSNLDQSALSQSQRKMFVTVSVILAAWIICWLPMMSVIMAITFADAFDVPLDGGQFVTMINYVEVMSYSNSLVNPILYFLTSSDFRKAASKLLFRCKTNDEITTHTSPDGTGSTKF